jgi:uncharacterized sulfatase
MKRFLFSFLCLHSFVFSAHAAQRPNVLIVINDDQSWLECSAYGNSSIQTPHFDRVAKAGVLFTHGYTSAPSCAPSRAALLTGRNFWELEQGAFIQAWLPAKFATLPDLLEPAGYHTGYTGKGYGPAVLPPPGRTRSPAGNVCNSAVIKSPPAGISSIDYPANFAKFLDARPADKPFYFWAGLMEPHHPHGQDNHQKLGLALDAIKLPRHRRRAPPSRQLPLRSPPRRQHPRRAPEAPRRPRRTRQHPRHRHRRQRHAHAARQGQRL